MKSGTTPIRRALLSVSDKTNLMDLGKFLEELGVELVSTGGTALYLKKGPVGRYGFKIFVIS